MATTVVGVMIAAVVTFFLITPKYESTAQLIVQTKQSGNGTTNLQNDINGNVLMINTYKDMIKGDIVIDAVQKQLKKEHHYSCSNKALKEMIEVEQTQNSQMFQIIATSSEPRQAATITNVTALTFQKTVEEVLEVNKVTITSEGMIPTESVFPNNKLIVLLGGLSGFIIGTIGAFLIELFDDTVKERHFVTDTLAFPILGSISEMDEVTQLGNRGTTTVPKVEHTLAARTLYKRNRERL